MKENEIGREKRISSRELWRFLIPSLIGVFLFLCPVWQDGAITIPIGILIDWIKAAIGSAASVIIYFFILLSMVMTLITKIFKPKAILNNKFLSGIFDTNYLQLLLRVAGSVFAVIIFFELPVEIVTSPNTGGTVSGLLVTTLVSIFVCCYSLPLIMDYGIMDFTGTVCRRFIHPLFKLPGRSAVDLLTSWVGGNSSGIILTIRQYETGYYNGREATIISTMFSVVSIPFCLVIANMLDVGHLFAQFYLTLCLVGILSTIIMVRIPPLSTFDDSYYQGAQQTAYTEVIPDGMSRARWGLQMAVEKAKTGGNVVDILKSGTKMYLDLLMTLAPIVMTIGVTALILTEYTPIFQWISMPMGYYLNLLGVEEAFAGAPATIVGFADMFLPAIVASGLTSVRTKFILGVLSLVQIIYLSEMGAVLLGSSIPVKLGHLIILFIEKTLIALPLIVLVSNLFF